MEHIIDSEHRPPFEDHWHTDVSWEAEPPTFGTLCAIDAPSPGGDTIWSSMYAAYEALSDTMKGLLSTLRAVHDMGDGQAFISKAGAEITARTRELFPGAEHPVVCVHPSTGRRYLYVNRQFTRRIVGLHDAESDALLGVPVEHATHPNFQIRHRWTAGDVCLWDERVTQHPCRGRPPPPATRDGSDAGGQAMTTGAPWGRRVPRRSGRIPTPKRRRLLWLESPNNQQISTPARR